MADRTITYNPDTHAVVPKEPTEAMVLAAEDLSPPRMFGFVYRAMIAAAPLPAVGQQDAPVKTEYIECCHHVDCGRCRGHGAYYRLLDPMPEPAAPSPAHEGSEAALDDFNAWWGEPKKTNTPQESAMAYWAQEAYLAGRASAPQAQPSVRDAALEEAAALCFEQMKGYRMYRDHFGHAKGAEHCGQKIRELKAAKGAGNG